MAIGNDNLWSGTYSTVKAFLEAQLTDPRRRYKSNWVHPGIPNINGKKFNGFPFIVLQVDYSEDRLSLDMVTTNKMGLMTFEIVSDDAGEVDTWADEIYSKIKVEGNLEEIKVKNLSSSPMVYDLDENNKKVYSRVIGLMGVFRK